MEDKISVWMVLTLVLAGVTLSFLFVSLIGREICFMYSYLPLSLTLASALMWIEGEQHV